MQTFKLPAVATVTSTVFFQFSHLSTVGRRSQTRK